MRVRSPLAVVVLVVAAFATAAAPATAAPLDRSRERIPPRPVTVPPAPAAARTDAAPATPIDGPEARRPMSLAGSPAAGGLRSSCLGTETGGDDLKVGFSDDIPMTFDNDSHAIDVAADGTIYTVQSILTSTYNELHLFRSTDGGVTWELWSTLSDSTLSLRNCHLEAVDVPGQPTRIFAMYRRGGSTATLGELRLSFADVGVGPPTWTTVDVLSDGALNYLDADLVIDDAAFSSYYLYVAAEVSDGVGVSIVFLRSFDQGLTWEAPVTVAPYSGGFSSYNPDLSWGDAGGGSVTVHLAWHVSDGAGSAAVRYARATADGSTWEPTVPITSTADTITHYGASIAASPTDADVVLAYEAFDGATPSVDSIVRTSTDGGLVWSSPDGVTFANRSAVNVECLPDGSEFAATALDIPCIERVLLRAPGSSPGSWGPAAGFSGPITLSVPAEMAPDPTRGNRWAVVWWDRVSTILLDYWFDAEWRGDPGWPNTEPGFPVSLGGTTAESAPALVDLDDDPSTLEIVFRDSAGDVRAFASDGTELPGFPVAAGNGGPLAPVAVGDLTGNGVPVIVTSTAAGEMFGIDATGSVRFSWNFGAVDTTCVTIAPLGPDSTTHLTAIVRDGVHIFTWNGQILTEIESVSLGGAHSQSPVSVGDLEGDGQPEYVVTAGTQVHVRRLGRTMPVWTLDLGHPLRQSATLADTDGDGDLEIAVPTEDGSIYLLQHDGTIAAGFPWNTGTQAPLTAVSFTRLTGGAGPDLVAGATNGELHAITAAPAVVPGFPIPPTSFSPVLGAPVADWIGTTTPSVVVSNDSATVWSYDADGAVTTGWPRASSSAVVPQASGAIGDIDGDGHNEVVLVTDVIQAFDVNHPGSTDAGDRWPMASHDPGRTGCSGCPAAGTSVGAEPLSEGAVPSTLRLAAPFPNPSRAGVGLEYALPAPAAVRIEVFDVTGRRAAIVEDARREAGIHRTSWDGTDVDGLPASAGIYFVRLRAQGTAGDLVKTRKISLIR